MIFQLTYCLMILILFLWNYGKKEQNKSGIQNPPELSGKLPIIGHALRFLGNRTQGVLNIKSIAKETLEKGGIVTVYLGSRIMYISANPDDCLKISNLCLEKDTFYDIAKPLLGSGITIAKVPLWKQNRKTLNTALSKKFLNGFMDIFNKQSRKLVHFLSAEVGKGPFQHDIYLQKIMFESICMTSYGIDIEKNNDLYENFVTNVNEALEIFYERFNKFWLHSDFIFKFTKMKKQQDTNIREIQKFGRTILEERKKAIENEYKTFDPADEAETFEPFLDIMLKMSMTNNCFDDEQVLYETISFITGGFDTSFTLNTYILTILGSHLDVQNKLLDEIEKIFGNSDRDVNVDDLPKLVYMEAVIKETLRVYPIAHATGRCIDRDIHLKNYTLKAGSGCIILFWALHRHPVWGKDAEVFRPERWFEDTLPNVNSAFGAFSMGRRNCIGKTYAMMSTKTFLVHILRNYRIYSNIDKMVFKLDVMLRPLKGHDIRIVKR